MGRLRLDFKKWAERRKRRPQDYEVGATFELTRRELRRAKTWSRLHMAVWGCSIGDKNAYTGAIGGRFHYTFAPTSIGTLATLHCACGKSILLNGDDL